MSKNATPETTYRAPEPAVVINLHAVQPVGGSLLNRDDTGAQKTITFGGALRTRISSQCWKRAARVKNRTGNVEQGAFALRTNHLPGEVADALVASGAVADTDIAEMKSAALFSALGFGVKSNRVTDNSVFVHQHAARDIAAVMAPHLDEIMFVPPAKKGAKPTGTAPKELLAEVKAAFDVNASIDIALFGSFLTVGSLKARHDGALAYNHAYSVDPARVVDDYFTAVDDVVEANRAADTGQDDAMSNNIGTSDLSAQVYYRTASVDVTQLRRLLKGDDELVSAAIIRAIETFATSLPNAKQTSTNVGTVPSLLLASVGSARLTADNAFTRPIHGVDVVGDAVDRLFAQVEFASRFTPGQTYVALAGDIDASARIPSAQEFTLPLTVESSLADLVRTVSNQVERASTVPAL